MILHGLRILPAVCYPTGNLAIPTSLHNMAALWIHCSKVVGATAHTGIRPWSFSITWQSVWRMEGVMWGPRAVSPALGWMDLYSHSIVPTTCPAEWLYFCTFPNQRYGSWFIELHKAMQEMHLVLSPAPGGSLQDSPWTSLHLSLLKQVTLILHLSHCWELLHGLHSNHRLHRKAQSPKRQWAFG